jgi:membrane fusion protein, multidrug efflux system
VDVRPVKVGERIGSDWIVAEGLKPGEKVVAEGTQKVRPGASVNPKPFVPATAAAGAGPKPEAKPANPAPEAKK